MNYYVFSTLINCSKWTSDPTYTNEFPAEMLIGACPAYFAQNSSLKNEATKWLIMHATLPGDKNFKTRKYSHFHPNYKCCHHNCAGKCVIHQLMMIQYKVLYFNVINVYTGMLRFIFNEHLLQVQINKSMCLNIWNLCLPPNQTSDQKWRNNQ